MPRHLSNKYSTEADDFSLGGGGFDSGFGGGMDSGLGMGIGGGSMPGSTPNDNGLKAQDVIAVRAFKRLLSFLNISFTKNIPDKKRPRPIHLYAYGRDELKYQPGFLGWNSRLPNSMTEQAQFGGIVDYLGRVVNNAANWDRESRTSNILTPEIQTAREVMVSSIMSPIDLQTDKVNIIIDDSGLPEELEQLLSKMLSDFFNKELQFGRRMAKWIGDGLYGPGSAPVLVLPQANIYTMRKLADMDLQKNGFDPKDLVKGIHPTTRPDTTKPITSGESLSIFDMPDIDGEMGFESLNLGPSQEAITASTETLVDRITTESYMSLEAMKMLPNKKAGKDDKGNDIEIDIPVTEVIATKDKMKKGIEQVLKNGLNYIRFSANPGLINQHNSKLQQNLEKMQKKIDSHLFQLGSTSSPIYMLDTEKAKDAEPSVDEEAAAIIDLPYPCVIPVIIPGTPSQHIGYFIAVNQWGDPITPENRDINNFYSNSRIMEANLQANMGIPSDLVATNDMSGTQRFKATSVIFGVMLKNIMEKKLEEYGLGGTQLEQHETITSCLFRNLLDQKRIGLVFVPEPMLTYFSYDFHDDGTGKSLLEDIRMIIGLRTTLVTAGVMAAAENSIDQKVISVNVDENNANFAQLLEQVRNAYIEKRVMRFDTNPFNITRQIASRSITLVPTGVRGIPENLSVQTDHRTAGAIQPDNPLLEQLNEWMIQALKVPASAMTQTSEADFARSVVTTNLCFNNRVKIYQLDTNRLGTKIIRAYLKYSTALQKRILDILKQSYHDSEEMDKDDPNLEHSQEDQAFSEDQKKKMREKADELREKDTHPHKSKTEVKMNKETPEEELRQIIEHAFVKLPEPRIVVDKAQYEEITGFADTVDRVCNIVYNESLLTESSQQYSATLRAMSAAAKEALVRGFIKTTAAASAFDLPTIRDIDEDLLMDMYRRLANVEKGLRNYRDQVDTKVNNNGEQPGMGGDMMGGLGGGMGGGFDTGMGGGTMGDLGLGTGTSSPDMNMNAGGDTTQQTPEGGGEEPQGL